MKRTTVLTSSANAKIADLQTAICSAYPEQTELSLQQTKSENPHKTHSSIQSALEHFDSLPDSALVRQPVVLKLFACSSATLWRWVKNSHAPAPKRIGNRISAWQVGELRAFLKNLEASGQISSNVGGK